MRTLLLALMLSLSMIGSAFAQAGNDFPSPGFNSNFPPYNQPFIPGVTQGHNYSYGNAWGPQTLWGVKQGDTVHFEIVMDWWGFAPMSLSPMSDQGDDFHYLHGNTNVDPWSQWVQPGIGYFCFRCSWSFRATEDNPQLRLEFLGSDQFGAHIEIGEITSGNTEQGTPTRPMVSDATKRSAGNAAAVGLVLSTIATGGSVIACTAGNYALCGTFAAISIGTSFATLYFERVAKDPWDWEYQYPYYAVIDYEDEYTYYWWTYEYTASGDYTGGWLPWLNWTITTSQLQMDAYLKAAAVTADRFESCVLVGDSCAEWQRQRGIEFLQLASIEMYYLGLYYKELADHLYTNGYNDENDIAGWIAWHGDTLIQESNIFWSAN